MHLDDSGEIVEGFATPEQEQLYAELVAEETLPEPTHEQHHDLRAPQDDGQA